MKEDKAIEELRGEYKHRVTQLAEAILALCDAKGEKSFASRDEVRWSDCTVHIMVFVEKKQRCRHRAKRNHPDPLTPEEELADTIKRQKELDV
jgi:hypothetical protein